jgi:hypothetical protein
MLLGMKKMRRMRGIVGVRGDFTELVLINGKWVYFTELVFINRNVLGCKCGVISPNWY